MSVDDSPEVEAALIAIALMPPGTVIRHLDKPSPRSKAEKFLDVTLCDLPVLIYGFDRSFDGYRLDAVNMTRRFSSNIESRVTCPECLIRMARRRALAKVSV